MMDKCNGKEGSHGTQHHLDSCGEIFLKGGKSDLVNCTGTRSQLSTLGTMSRNFSPGFVYQRRRQVNENSIPIIANGIKPIYVSQSDYSLEAQWTRSQLCTGTRSQLSSLGKISRNYSPGFVYQRRKQQMENSIPIIANGIKPIDVPQSGIRLEAQWTRSQLCTGNRSQLSSLSTMSRNFYPAFVYQRRKQKIENSIPIIANGIKPIDVSQPAISIEALPVEPHIITKVSNDTVDRIFNVSDANEDFSSSKYNLELSSASRKLTTDDAAECSSSDALIKQSVISAKDLCISFLKSQGLLCNTFQGRQRKGGVGTENLYSKRACGVCRFEGSTLHMLVCDSCENGFHVSCYSPVITVLPVGEWLCGCCFKKDEILKDIVSRADDSSYMGNEAGRDQCLGSEGELGSLEFMFRDTKPYISNAKIGDECQAEVPDFSGPGYEECGIVGVPLETGPCDNINMQGGDSAKSLQLNSIDNWLQCQAVIEGVGDDTDGNICAKWRRAPILEVQTDKLECFCCIQWDPAHADCAVPQELDTKEVEKQLKHIGMLKPRLSKRRKVDPRSKGNGSNKRKVDPRSKGNGSKEHP